MFLVQLFLLVYSSLLIVNHPDVWELPHLVSQISPLVIFFSFFDLSTG